VVGQAHTARNTHQKPRFPTARRKVALTPTTLLIVLSFVFSEGYRLDPPYYSPTRQKGPLESDNGYHF